MEKLDAVYYFVHLGYDEEEQPEFEKSVTERMELIIDRTKRGLKQAVVMIDEPVLNKEQSDKYNLVEIAQILNDYLVRLQFLGPLNKLDLAENKIIQLFEDNERGYGIISEIMKLLLEETLFLTRRFDIDITKELDENNRKQDELFIDIMENRFLEILKILRKKYKDKNIGNTTYSEGSATNIPSNLGRRSRLHKIVGDSGIPIIQGYMRDVDISRLNASGKFKTHIPTEVWEQEFGNALPLILKVSSLVHRRQIRKLFYLMVEDFRQRGLLISESTLHVIGGEYHGRCNTAFAEILNALGGVNYERMRYDTKASLVKKGDEGISL